MVKTLYKYNAYQYIKGVPYFLNGKPVYLPSFIKKTPEIFLKALQSMGIGRAIVPKTIEMDGIEDEVIWLWIDDELSYQLWKVAEVTSEITDSSI